MADGPYVIRGWKDGMNNVLPDYDLPANEEGVQSQLRNVVNADILPSGRLKRRAGITQKISGNVHSTHVNGSRLYAVVDDELCETNPDFTTTTLRAVTPGRLLSYVDIADTVYFSDGVIKGRVIDGALSHWGVETPSSPPAMASTAGALQPGRYMSVVTYIDELGEESGCGASSELSLSAAGGITLTLPAPTQAHVAKIRIYFADANDGIFYSIADVPADTSSYTVTMPPVHGPSLETQFMRDFLPCDMLTEHKGRIYGAVGNILWHTQPLRYGLYKPSTNFIVFPAPISIIASVSNGMYVVSDQTYWMAGSGPEDFTLDVVLQYTAAKGSLSKLPRGEEVVWYSSAGIVQAGPGGQVKLIQEPNVRGAPAPTGATLYMEDRSIKKVVAAVDSDPFATGLSATDYVDAEIIRARRE